VGRVGLWEGIDILVHPGETVAPAGDNVGYWMRTCSPIWALLWVTDVNASYHARSVVPLDARAAALMPFLCFRRVAVRRTATIGKA
jgi:hypothetical protein